MCKEAVAAIKHESEHGEQIVTAVLRPMQVFDEAFAKQFPAVTRWFMTLVHQPHFHKVMGAVQIPTEPMKYNPKNTPAAAAKKESKPEQPKKEKAPAAAAKVMESLLPLKAGALMTMQRKNSLPFMPSSDCRIRPWKEKVYSGFHEMAIVTVLEQRCHRGIFLGGVSAASMMQSRCLQGHRHSCV